MAKRTDITGQRFGHFVVLEHVPDRTDGSRARRFYKCRCDCGNIVVVRSDNLICGHSTKCVKCALMSRKKVKKNVDREF